MEILITNIPFICSVSPKISTEDGNIVIASRGDLVLQAGGQGRIHFLSASGEEFNTTGPAGPPVSLPWL